MLTITDNCEMEVSDCPGPLWTSLYVGVRSQAPDVSMDRHRGETVTGFHVLDGVACQPAAGEENFETVVTVAFSSNFVNFGCSMYTTETRETSSKIQAIIKFKN